MSVEVKNTLCFRFPNGSARPSLAEIAAFVKTLDANAAEMEATYRISEEKAVFMKFKSEESMLYAFEHNAKDLKFRYVDGKTVDIIMSRAGGTVEYVRVYDLPPEVPDRDVATVLGKFGKVERVIREKFPVDLGLDMQTGVRGVYIDVRQEIPCSLRFLNRKGSIFYNGIKNKCFLCKLEGHQISSCPKRKARNSPKNEKDEERNQNEEKQEQQEEHTDNGTGNGTYAGAVSGSLSLEIEVLDEQVVEMDVITPDTLEDSKAETTESSPLVFKCPNDKYFYNKFGIMDYTEKERIKDEEEAMRLAAIKEKRKEEIRKLRAQEKAAGGRKSPPRKK